MRFATNGKRAGTKYVKRWQFVGFPGPAGGESRGIVDLLAIRRDHGEPPKGTLLCRGDLFEIGLVQIKGGSADWPTAEDVKRLEAVRDYYHAKVVVLASWKKGSEPSFYVLKRLDAEGRAAWDKTRAAVIFGSAQPVEEAAKPEKLSAGKKAALTKKLNLEAKAAQGNTVRLPNACIYCGESHPEDRRCAQFEARARRFNWEPGDITFKKA